METTHPIPGATGWVRVGGQDPILCILLAGLSSVAFPDAASWFREDPTPHMLGIGVR